MVCVHFRSFVVTVELRCYRCPAFVERMAFISYRGDENGSAHFCPVYTLENPRGFTSSSLRTRRMQTAMPCHSESLLVSRENKL